MFKEVSEYITCFVDELGSIVLDSIVIYQDKKLEAVLSRVGYMASASILPDYTYDFLAITIEDECVIMNNTTTCSDIGTLLLQIRIDFQNFANLQ